MLRSFQHKLSIACSLSLREWLILIQAWWILLYYNLALRLFSLEKVRISNVRQKPGKLTSSQQLKKAGHMQRLVSLAARLHLPPAACLSRSLALQRMLAWQGIPSNLCIGINRQLVDIHAHAWVEVNGQPIGEPGDIQDKFRVLEPVGTSASKENPSI